MSVLECYSGYSDDFRMRIIGPVAYNVPSTIKKESMAPSQENHWLQTHHLRFWLQAHSNYRRLNASIEQWNHLDDNHVWILLNSWLSIRLWLQFSCMWNTCKIAIYLRAHKIEVAGEKKLWYNPLYSLNSISVFKNKQAVWYSGWFLIETWEPHSRKSLVAKSPSSHTSRKRKLAKNVLGSENVKRSVKELIKLGQLKTQNYRPHNHA